MHPSLFILVLLANAPASFAQAQAVAAPSWTAADAR